MSLSCYFHVNYNSTRSFNNGMIKNTLVQARSQVFSLGGAFGERSEPMRPKQLRSERSEQAVAGVWGRSPQRGPGAEPLGGG